MVEATDAKYDYKIKRGTGVTCEGQLLWSVFILCNVGLWFCHKRYFESKNFLKKTFKKKLTKRSKIISSMNKTMSVLLILYPWDLAVFGMGWMLSKYFLTLLANYNLVVVVSGLTLVIYLFLYIIEVKVKPILTGLWWIFISFCAMKEDFFLPLGWILRHWLYQFWRWS